MLGWLGPKWGWSCTLDATGSSSVHTPVLLDWVEAHSFYRQHWPRASCPQFLLNLVRKTQLGRIFVCIIINDLRTLVILPS